jgi:hypothetical protein
VTPSSAYPRLYHRSSKIKTFALVPEIYNTKINQMTFSRGDHYQRKSVMVCALPVIFVGLLNFNTVDVLKALDNLFLQQLAKNICIDQLLESLNSDLRLLA